MTGGGGPNSAAEPVEGAEVTGMKHKWFLFCAMIVLVVGSGSPAADDYLDRMSEEHRGDRPVPSPAANGEPAAPVEGSTVTYASLDGRPVEGFLARPVVGAESAPGIIVIHEWWGLNDNIRSMARRLAGEGYVALAVDLYEGQAATNRDEARTLAGAARERASSLEENLRQAYRYLEGEQGAPKIGVIGWCFGGGWSLRTALLLPEKIDATVIYYGRLVTDRERLETLGMPILGLFGAEDRGIPVGTVREFETALTELGKSSQIRIYEGAGHAFANPSGTRYHERAATDAWARTLAFFEENLKG